VKVKFAMDSFIAKNEELREKTKDYVDDLMVEFLNYRN
jgi:hypothetical protein